MCSGGCWEKQENKTTYSVSWWPFTLEGEGIWGKEPSLFYQGIYSTSRGGLLISRVFAETIRVHPGCFRIAAHLNLLQPSKLTLMGKFSLAVDRLPFHHPLCLLPAALHLFQVIESYKKREREKKKKKETYNHRSTKKCQHFHQHFFHFISLFTDFAMCVMSEDKLSHCLCNIFL